MMFFFCDVLELTSGVACNRMDDFPLDTSRST